MMSMHSLLSRTAVIDIPDTVRDFDMFEIRRDTTRHKALLYVMVWKSDVQEKLLSKSKESFLSSQWPKLWCVKTRLFSQNALRPIMKFSMPVTLKITFAAWSD